VFEMIFKRFKSNIAGVSCLQNVFKHMNDSNTEQLVLNLEDNLN
jgi:RecB family endonuclease NucS